jgi:hypothetical protein
MKKARIFLTALTVLAIAGGALAFKAKGLPREFAQCNTVNLKCEINTITTNWATTEIGGFNISYNELGAPCALDQGTYTCTARVTIVL